MSNSDAESDWSFDPVKTKSGRTKSGRTQVTTCNTIPLKGLSHSFQLANSICSKFIVTGLASCKVTRIVCYFWFILDIISKIITNSENTVEWTIAQNGLINENTEHS